MHTVTLKDHLKHPNLLDLFGLLLVVSWFVINRWVPVSTIWIKALATYALVIYTIVWLATQLPSERRLTIRDTNDGMYKLEILEARMYKRHKVEIILNVHHVNDPLDKISGQPRFLLPMGKHNWRLLKTNNAPREWSLCETDNFGGMPQGATCYREQHY